MFESIEDAGRGALALNNLGVDLLRRQCYSQAHDTLRDAAQVIMVVAKNKEEGITSVRECNVSAMLREAYQRLARPQKTAFFHIPISPESPISAVQLESEEFDMENERDLGIAASVVAYNAALSHFRLSQFGDYKSLSSIHGLHCQAQSFFQTSYLLLILSLPEMDGTCDSPHVLNCIIRVITGLIESSKDVPVTVSSEKFISEASIEQLNQVVLELHLWYKESQSAFIGAAAA